MIGAGLEGVRQRAENQAKEFGRMQAAVRGDWQRAEEWIKGEIDRRMDQMGQRLSEAEAQFSATSQRLEDEVKLAGAMEERRLARIQESSEEVS